VSSAPVRRFRSGTTTDGQPSSSPAQPSTGKRRLKK
jgi:hypothetical protein